MRRINSKNMSHPLEARSHEQNYSCFFLITIHKLNYYLNFKQRLSRVSQQDPIIRNNKF